MTGPRKAFIPIGTFGTNIARVRYAAGLMDGEGVISISAIPRLIVGVVNTNPLITEWLYENFGGGVDMRRPPGNRRPIFFWRFEGLEAKQCVDFLAPALVAKAPHAEVVKDIRVCFDKLVITTEHKERMQALNRGAHLVSLYADMPRWIHQGRIWRNRRRLAILATAKKRCPVCKEPFGPHLTECLGRFWDRLFCSSKCAGRARQYWSIARHGLKLKRTVLAAGIVREGKA